MKLVYTQPCSLQSLFFVWASGLWKQIDCWGCCWQTQLHSPCSGWKSTEVMWHCFGCWKMPQTTEAFSSVTLQPITSPCSLSSPMHVFLLSTLIISHVRPSFWTVTNFMGHRSFIVVMFLWFEHRCDPYLPPGFKLFTCRQSNWIHVFIFKLLMDPMKDESHASIHLNIAFQKIWRHRRCFFFLFSCVGLGVLLTMVAFWFYHSTILGSWMLFWFPFILKVYLLQFCNGPLFSILIYTLAPSSLALTREPLDQLGFKWLESQKPHVWCRHWLPSCAGTIAEPLQQSMVWTEGWSVC